MFFQFLFSLGLIALGIFTMDAPPERYCGRGGCASGLSISLSMILLGALFLWQTVKEATGWRHRARSKVRYFREGREADPDKLINDAKAEGVTKDG